MLITSLPEDWKQALAGEFTEPYFETLATKVQDLYLTEAVYPPAEQLFRAFELCPYMNTKVVIIGQDPYHGKGQAHGLCFSVQPGAKCPPSLKNIFREIASDIPGTVFTGHGDLEKWARQGVLLLNAILTVTASMPGSHKKIGWEIFTDAVIRTLSEKRSNIVFMLWGNFAISKAALIDQHKHLVLQSAHPSPLARGAFFGNHHFSKANSYLAAHGKEPVNWSV